MTAQRTSRTGLSAERLVIKRERDGCAIDLQHELFVCRSGHVYVGLTDKLYPEASQDVAKQSDEPAHGRRDFMDVHS